LRAEQLALKPGDRVILTWSNQTEEVRTMALGPIRGQVHRDLFMVWLVGSPWPVLLQQVRPIESPSLTIDHSPLATSFDRCRRLLRKWLMASGQWRVVPFVVSCMRWVRRRAAGRRLVADDCHSARRRRFVAEKK
jgi:hypothetical protein